MSLKYFLFVLLSLFPGYLLSQKKVDVLIINGKIIDGTGNSWFYGDIAIRKGKIFSIGRLSHLKARDVIDARKQVIAPGFIDVHTHIEGDEKRTPTADNFIHDGVTTVITGNCGSSNANIKDYFRMLESLSVSVNVATFIGHNTVRQAVLGTSSREPNKEELRKMEELVEKGMKDGAVGLSTGLIYIPGTYAKTGEVISLAKAASKYYGTYTSHIRSESQHVFEALEEALNVGKQAGMPVQISHFKIGKPFWGQSDKTLALVRKAREDGYDVTIDQYPYTASSTTLNSVIPSWVLENGRDSMITRINNPATHQRIVAEMVSDMEKRQRTSFEYAVVSNFKSDTNYNGKSISEINLLMGRKGTITDEIETILDLTKRGGAAMVFHSMDEADVKNILQYPFTMVASDSGIREFGAGVPHPRGYGTNARVLAKYVREEQVIGLEDAVRRMTSLPAQKFEFKDRGLLREGMAADIIIFDPETVEDVSTYEKPHAFSTGIEYVLVNGKITLNKMKHTGVRNGQILHGPSFTK